MELALVGKITNMSNQALIVVDFQHDLVAPEGKFPVKGAHKITPLLNQIIDKFKQTQQLIIFARCWYPRNHMVFAGSQEHCTACSSGAMLYSKVLFPTGALVLNKGTNARDDNSSAFTASCGYFFLDHYLQDQGVSEVFVAGIPLEGAMKATCGDSVAENYKTTLVTDCTKSRTVKDKSRTLQELKELGVMLYPGKKVLSQIK